MLAGVLGTVAFAVGLVLAMLDDGVNGVNGVNAGVADKAVGAVILATLGWFVWRVTLYRALRSGSRPLSCANPF